MFVVIGVISWLWILFFICDVMRCLRLSWWLIVRGGWMWLR